MKNIWKRIEDKMNDWWNKNPLIILGLVFVSTFSAYAAIYLPSPGISFMDDHFFIYKYASLLRTHGWEVVWNFPWMHFTGYTNGQYRFPVTLFNLLYVPFTLLSDPILGLKLADLVLASLSITIIYYVLRKFGTRWSLIYILILLSIDYHMARLLSGRAFVLTVSLTFLELYLAVGKKHTRFFWVSLIHVLLHQTTFYIPLLIGGIVEVARYLASQKFHWKTIIVGSLAMVLGMTISPGFPHVLWSFVFSLTELLWHTNQGGLKAEGTELYTKSFWNELVPGFQLVTSFLLIGLIFPIYYYVRQKKEESQEELVKTEQETESIIAIYALFLFTLITFFGTMNLTGRFFDFCLVATIISAALVITKLYNEKKYILDDSIKRYVFVVVLLFFGFTSIGNFLQFKKKMDEKDYRPYQHVAEWIAKESDDKEVVFLHNWSWFAPLIFFNDKNVYSSGIEPRGLLDYSPELYWKWYNMFNYNYYCAKLADCEEEVNSRNEWLKTLSDEKRKEAEKKNSQAIISSIKNDFQSRFIVSIYPDFNETISISSDLVEASFEATSELDGAKVRVYKLK